MITIKKIESLKPRVRVRKCISLMHLAYKGEELSNQYINSLYDILARSELLSDDDKAYFKAAFSEFLDGNHLRGEDIYYRGLKILGEEVADWDFIDDSGLLDESKRVIYDRYLLLDRVRSPYNIGSIFRSSESFGIKHIYLYECGDVSSNRALRTSRGAIDSLKYSIITSLDNLPGPFFALELGGKELKSFNFPHSGTCIIGSEESGLSPETLKLASSSLGKVSIKTGGAKGSLNVAVATGIMLHSWF